MYVILCFVYRIKTVWNVHLVVLSLHLMITYFHSVYQNSTVLKLHGVYISLLPHQPWCKEIWSLYLVRIMGRCLHNKATSFSIEAMWHESLKRNSMFQIRNLRVCLERHICTHRYFVKRRYSSKTVHLTDRYIHNETTLTVCPLTRLISNLFTKNNTWIVQSSDYLKLST